MVSDADIICLLDAWYLAGKAITTNSVCATLRTNRNRTHGVIRDWRLREGILPKGKKGAERPSKPGGPGVEKYRSTDSDPPRDLPPMPALKLPTTLAGPSSPKDAGQGDGDVVILMAEMRSLIAELTGKLLTPATSPAAENSGQYPDVFATDADEALRVLAALGPVYGMAIFSELAGSTQTALGYRRIQEALSWAAANGIGIVRLSDGRWSLRNSMVEVPRKRRSPSDLAVSDRAFADFAFDLISNNQRPYASTELYDQAKRMHLPFVRELANDVLTRFAHPELRKQKDGAWQLRNEPDMRVKGRYHSRRRLEIFQELGHAVLMVATAAGSPISMKVLKERLPADLVKQLPPRGFETNVRKALKDQPQLEVAEGMCRISARPEVAEHAAEAGSASEWAG
jgi:hypothetical protein